MEKKNDKKRRKGWKYWFSRIALWIWEWEIEGTMPQGVDKVEIVVAPHRYALGDVALGWFVQNVEPIPPRLVLMKADLFQVNWKTGWGLLGKVLINIGAFPVDRYHNLGLGVAKGIYKENLGDEIDARERVAFVVTPEGKRKSEIIETEFGKLDQGQPFQRGFWVIAIEKHLPVVLAAYNYRNKTVSLSEPFYFTGNLDEDMDKVFNWYRKTVPWYWPNIDKSKFM